MRQGKLRLLQIKEDIVMQLLWKSKMLTAEDIWTHYPLKRPPSLKNISAILRNLEQAAFVTSVKRNQKLLYAPAKERRNDIRFRAHYRLVGYFTGSFNQLHNYLLKIQVDEVPLFESLRDNIGEVIRLSIVKGYYWVKYPNETYEVRDVLESEVDEYRKELRRNSRCIVLAEGLFVKPRRTVFVLAFKASGGSNDFKKTPMKAILSDKTVLLHRRFYRNSLK